ncbi:amino oxidase [Leptospira perolatii]|uniref:Amino oxidase n=1 Tax=Leptospira perolatii TaxID=2023191 RepID=A0A2M9ZRF9_9LEPT|nr:NAD(P)-binding protein [Leptospira perolatii]PJZ71017.1 amino oxidase [Leptospira perolatii]PJZ74549.1 amino oxidase [Leptospira perolatii]
MQKDRFSRKFFLSTVISCLGILGLGSFFKFRKPEITGSILGPNKELGHKIREPFSPPSILNKTKKAKVIIAGAGISGLATGYYLSKSGFQDYLILELETEAGGNSKFGNRNGFKFPWGAHYLPQPNSETVLVRKLLEDFGLVIGKDPKGNPIYSEKILCFDPEERIFYQGRWQSGLVPRRTGEPDKQELKFRSLMDFWRTKVGRDGRKAFAIPMELSSRDPEILSLDKISFREYLENQKINSEELLWYADYCMRDDYGGSLSTISAWAGIHYFSSRNVDETGEDPAVITWPEGNGFLMEKLKELSKDRIQTSSLVRKIRKSGSSWEVFGFNGSTSKEFAFESEYLVYALPSFTRRYILSENQDYLKNLTYSPWLVANLFVNKLPLGKGHAPAWDNVIYKSPSLGYIISTHQDLRAQRPQSVLTYYLAFGGEDTLTSKQKMMRMSWRDWKKEILVDLKRPHPNIENLVFQMDIMTHAHAMIRPTPGFLWGGKREKLSQTSEGVIFAHSDLSGFSLFEEALYRGHEAARKILQKLNIHS